MVLRFCDFQKFEIAGLTPWSKWVALSAPFFLSFFLSFFKIYNATHYKTKSFITRRYHNYASSVFVDYESS